MDPAFALVAFATNALLAMATIGWQLRLRARRRKRSRRRDAQAFDLRGEELADVVRELPFPGTGKVGVLDDPVIAWAARWRLIAGAKRTVDVATYILAADAFGISLLGLLLKKQREGVRVRLLVDSLGTFQSARPKPWRQLMEPLVEAGATVRIYNALTVRSFLRVWKRRSVLPAIACDHDKVLVVDGAVGISGGRNIAREYFADPRDHPHVFFDKEAVLHAPACVAGLAAAFERELSSRFARPLDCDRAAACDEALLELAGVAMERWLGTPPDAPVPTAAALAAELRAEADCVADPDLERRLHDFTTALVGLPHLRGALALTAAELHEADIHVVDSSSGAIGGPNKLNESLLRMLAAAKRSVLIQTPYLVMPERALFALENAAARGVQITLLTNSPASSDNPLSQAVFMSQWPRLLARVRGMRLFVVAVERNEHTKAAVLDDEVAIVGSYNLDVISAGMNSELAMVLRGDRVVDAVGASMRRRIAEARTVVEYRVDMPTARSPRATRRPRVLFGPEDHVPARALWRTKLLLPLAALIRAMPRIAEP